MNRVDIELARSLGIIASMHLAVGMYGEYVAPGRALAQAGLLGSDINLTHCNRLKDDEIAMAVDCGSSISVTPEVEMQMGHGIPATGKVHAAGGRVGAGHRRGLQRQRRHVLPDALCRSNAKDAGERRRTRRRRNAWSDCRSAPATPAHTFATIEGARALRLDSRIGSITPGKDVDVTVLSWSHERSSPLVNPVQAVVFHGSVANVHTVIVRGEVRKYAHRPLATHSPSGRSRS